MPVKSLRTTLTPEPDAPLVEGDFVREDILKRLRRIEGQTRGVQRMIEQDRGCTDVLDQLAAIQQAVRGVSGLVATKYAMECIKKGQDHASDQETQETAAALVDAILRAPR